MKPDGKKLALAHLYPNEQTCVCGHIGVHHESMRPHACTNGLMSGLFGAGGKCPCQELDFVDQVDDPAAAVIGDLLKERTYSLVCRNCREVIVHNAKPGTMVRISHSCSEPSIYLTSRPTRGYPTWYSLESPVWIDFDWDLSQHFMRIVSSMFCDIIYNAVDAHEEEHGCGWHCVERRRLFNLLPERYQPVVLAMPTPPMA